MAQTLEAPTKITIRSQVLHPPKKETDVYITKSTSISSMVPNIEKKIFKYGFVDLHSLGAANYKCLKIGMLVKKSHPNEIVAKVSTDTTETTNFTIPIGKDSQEKEANHMLINSVTVHISKM